MKNDQKILPRLGCRRCGKEIKHNSIIPIISLSLLFIINLVFGFHFVANGEVQTAGIVGLNPTSHSQRMVLGVKHKSEKIKEAVTISRRDFFELTLDSVCPQIHTTQYTNTQEEDIWFNTALCSGKIQEVIKGYSDGTIQGNKKINIAEALKIVIEVNGVALLDDGGEWFDKYMKYAQKMKVFQYIEKNPANEITILDAERIISLLSK